MQADLIARCETCGCACEARLFVVKDDGFKIWFCTREHMDVWLEWEKDYIEHMISERNQRRVRT